MRKTLGEAGLQSDDRRVLLVAQENSREYRLSNPARTRLLKYRVDGHWPQKKTTCDYAIGLPDKKRIILIELKGKDIRHAAVQILDTIEYISTKKLDVEIHARIVLSRVSRPDIRSSDVIRLEKELIKYKGDVKRASVLIEEQVW